MMLQYLIESSLLDGSFLQYLPSVTAATAICLANLMLGSTDPWVIADWKIVFLENCVLISFLSLYHSLCSR